jgi:hypothetical protein
MRFFPHRSGNRLRFALRLMVYMGLWFALAMSAMLVLLAAMHAIYAVAASLVAGAMVRWVGQRQRLASLQGSRKPAPAVRFVFDGKKIHCLTDQRRLELYMSAREWRWAAAVTSGLLCWAVLHLGRIEGDLISAFGAYSDRWNVIAASFSAALPLCVALVFLVGGWPGEFWEPQKRWMRQAHSVLRARVAKANAMMDREQLDGLVPGVEFLLQAFGIEQGTDYHHTARLAVEQAGATAALDSEMLRHTLDVCAEIARQDLYHLREVAPGYRDAERNLSIARTLSPLVTTFDLQLRTRELEMSFEGLSSLAAERRWQELERETSVLTEKLADLCTDLRSEVRLQSTGLPTAVLTPGTDAYQILGITPDTPAATIRKLRLSLAQIYHPDIGAATSNSRKMAEVNAAYDEVMKNRRMQ